MYAIEVYPKNGVSRNLTAEERAEVETAISHLLIENEDRNSNVVWVEPMDVDEAVRALNAIGFTTDEDYLVFDSDDDNDD